MEREKRWASPRDRDFLVQASFALAYFDDADKDQRMPRMIRRKAIFMSGYASPEKEASISQKDIPFLPKPFSPAELVRKVREVLDSRPP